MYRCNKPKEPFIYFTNTPTTPHPTMSPLQKKTLTSSTAAAAKTASHTRLTPQSPSISHSTPPPSNACPKTSTCPLPNISTFDAIPRPHTFSNVLCQTNPQCNGPPHPDGVWRPGAGPISPTKFWRPGPFPRRPSTFFFSWAAALLLPLLLLLLFSFPPQNSPPLVLPSSLTMPRTLFVPPLVQSLAFFFSIPPRFACVAFCVVPNCSNGRPSFSLPVVPCWWFCLGSNPNGTPGTSNVGSTKATRNLCENNARTAI